MTKKQFRQFAKDHNITVKDYSGNDRTMYVYGSMNNFDAMMAHFTGTQLSFKISQILNP